MAEIPLRFKRPLNLPLIGRIKDDVDFASATLPLHLWEEGEDIQEDPNQEEVVKDGAYYRNLKKRRRSYYRNKQVFKFEDSAPRVPDGPPVGLQYEGKVWDPTISSVVEEQEKRLHYLGNKSQKHDEAFKYVLLVPTKVPSSTQPGAPLKTEISVVPVRDFVLFSKPSVMKMKTLDELDEDFETKMQRDKRKLSEYSRIVKGLNRLEREKSGRRGGDDDDGEGGELREEPGSMAELFGLAANSKLKKGLKKGANAKTFLDANGNDLDEQKRVGEMFAGDYEAHFVDNEETYADESADQVQQQDDDRAMADMTKTAAFIKKGNEGLSDNDDDDDDDSENDNDDDDDDGDGAAGGGGGGGSGGGGVGGGGGGGGIGGGGGGGAGGGVGPMIDDRLLMQARLAGRGLNSAARAHETEAQQAAALAAASSLAAGATGAGPSKRKAAGDSAAGADSGAEPGAGAGAAKRAKAEPASAAAAAAAAAAAGSSAGSGSAAAAAAAAAAGAGAGAPGEYELTDDGMRRYLTFMGGRVTLDNVKKTFKAQVKALNRTTPSNDVGKNRIMDILNRLTITVQDAALGKVLQLRK